MRRWAVLVLIVLLCAPLAASAQVSYRLRYVMGSGGSSSGRLMGTFGQPVATDPGRLCAGFWCGDLVSTVVGTASIIYRWTFDDMGATAALVVLVVIVALRWVYDSRMVE